MGTVIDAADGSPVEGVLVLLLDTEGRQESGDLTDAHGSFSVAAGEAGAYTLRAIRIGYETLRSIPVKLWVGESETVDLRIPREPIQLRGIEVQGTQQCRLHPEEGRDLALVWNEVRKALTVQAWSAQAGQLRFGVSTFVRDLDPSLERVLLEKRGRTEVLGRVPMQSLPAGILMEEGFVRDLGFGSFEYLGPDAQVVLADAFLNTHCLHLSTRDSLPSLVGVSFQPVDETGAPDVVGTLWVDRSTAELRFLEFGYTWVPFNKGRKEAGGRLEFELLPNGAWIVRKWWIRMPTVERLDAYRTRLKGFRETGAEVVTVSSVGWH